MEIARIAFRRLAPLISRTPSVNANTFCLANRLTCCSNIHTSAVKRDMMEFFDLQNFDSDKVSVGRPWRRDELRLKSHQDLHKLWYVLLKERNMLLTMQQMYEDAMEPFISPSRVFKVEESMGNILAVVKERNYAVDMLETGKSDVYPKKKVTRNVFGLPVLRPLMEHHKPKHASTRSKKMFMEYQPWMDRYLALYEEKLRKKRNLDKKRYLRYKNRLIKELNVKKEDIPEFKPNNRRLKSYLRRMTELNDHGHKD